MDDAIIISKEETQEELTEKLVWLQGNEFAYESCPVPRHFENLPQHDCCSTKENVKIVYKETFLEKLKRIVYNFLTD